MSFLHSRRVFTFTTRIRSFSIDSCTQQNSGWVTHVPRTDTDSPSKQCLLQSSCVGRFYKVPEPFASRVVAPFLTESHLREISLFDDFSILVRKPAIDVISSLKTIFASYESKSATGSLINTSVPRFILYGQPGCGISVQMAHIAHFAAENNSFIFAFCNAENWLDRCSDFTPSDTFHQKQHQSEIEGEAIDFPSRSAQWLGSFLKLNETILKERNPVITRPIEWTAKDTCSIGTPWTEVIDFAMNRTKYSTDCIGILLREMRTISNSADGPFSFLFIDGVNFLWCRGTRMQDKILQKKVAVNRLAIVHHLQRALIGDWKRGAIVTSVNQKAAWPSDREKYTPGYLLTKKGFETMDPFIPVMVNNYTPSEQDNALQFYAGHGWLTNPAALTPEGRAEIVFLADCNPRELARIAAEW